MLLLAVPGSGKTTGGRRAAALLNREFIDCDEQYRAEYGITPEEFPKFVSNARSTMGILFKLDRLQLSDEDLVKIYTESYR